MQINLKQPVFQQAKPDETMREFALALAAVKAGEQWCPPGTAVIIGERLALTAKHLFEKEWNRLGEYSVVAGQFLGQEPLRLIGMPREYSRHRTVILRFFFSLQSKDHRARRTTSGNRLLSLT